MATNTPDIRTGKQLLPGLAAVALFVLLAAAFLTSSFSTPTGFPADASIVSNIGYALFNIDAGGVPAEGFIAAFFTVAIVLDAALDGAILLARREGDEQPEAVVPERERAQGGEE